MLAAAPRTAFSIKAEQINTIFAWTAIRWQGRGEPVSYVDTAAPLLGPDRSFIARLPCLPNESANQGCSPDGNDHRTVGRWHALLSVGYGRQDRLSGVVVGRQPLRRCPRRRHTAPISLPPESRWRGVRPPLPRQQFPVTERYIYLNHAGIAPIPQVSVDAMHDAAIAFRDEGGLAYEPYDEVMSRCGPRPLASRAFR